MADVAVAENDKGAQGKGPLGRAKKKRVGIRIDMTPMVDVAFLLLIFFMVTTVFRKERKRDIDWTAAEATKKIDEKRKHILHLWVMESGEVYINDQLVTSFPYDAVPSGCPAFFASTFEEGGAVWAFDNVIVREIGP